MSRVHKASSGEIVRIDSNGNLNHPVLPARIWPDGSREWFKNGKPHRKGGPAKIWADKTMEWWVDGMRHRERYPAILRADGYKEWVIRGKTHREEGPAKIFPDRQEFYIHNRRHNETGFAVINLKTGRGEHYLAGQFIAPELFEVFSKLPAEHQQTVIEKLWSYETSPEKLLTKLLSTV